MSFTFLNKIQNAMSKTTNRIMSGTLKQGPKYENPNKTPEHVRRFNEFNWSYAIAKH